VTPGDYDAPRPPRRSRWRRLHVQPGRNYLCTRDAEEERGVEHQTSTSWRCGSRHRRAENLTKDNKAADATPGFRRMASTWRTGSARHGFESTCGIDGGRLLADGAVRGKPRSVSAKVDCGGRYVWAADGRACTSPRKSGHGRVCTRISIPGGGKPSSLTRGIEPTPCRSPDGKHLAFLHSRMAGPAGLRPGSQPLSGHGP